MTTVTIRIPDDIVHNIDTCANHLNLTRSEYIKRAILAMNKTLKDDARAQRLRNASQRVRQESMVVNAEFSAIEHDPKD